MGKVCILTEKPDVARTIARVLRVTGKGEGCFHNERYVVTWALGHVVDLQEPEDYDPAYKRWSLQALPIIPERFGLKVAAGKRGQFSVIKRFLLSPEVDEVVAATDAGREGEEIFRRIYELSGCRKPFRRLWISSLTDEAVLAGFRALRPGHDFDRLADAARSRSEADWLVGLNATRALTKKHGALLSAGRVQTPTLAILVRREQEIERFQPQDYWELWADFGLPGGTYRGKWCRDQQDRFDNAQAAHAAKSRVQGQSGTVARVTAQREEQPPPQLFDLTGLQREANRRFGFSAKKTLDVAQKLYERHKLITYPRTDSRFLSRDLAAQLGRTVQALHTPPYAELVEQVWAAGLPFLNKRFVDDAKVSDHHAIIPTPKSPDLAALSPDERKVYDLIARRLLGAFLPAAVWLQQELITQVAGETFRTRGRQLLEPGWRVAAGAEPEKPNKRGDKQEEEQEGPLPPVREGDLVAVLKAAVAGKQTKPPQRYTEGTLLAAMEGAGRLIDDEALREAMKQRGIGTPATRAAIIERLIAVKYVMRTGKQLLPTAKGRELIERCPVPELISPELTGQWEQKLADIEQGRLERGAFLREVQALTRRIVQDVLAMPAVAGWAEEKKPAAAKSAGAAKSAATDAEPLGNCPQCGAPVVEGQKGYGCSAWRQGCKFTIWKEIKGKKLTKTAVKLLLTKGITGRLKGFRSAAGKPFSARLRLVPGAGGRLEFVFEENLVFVKENNPAPDRP